MKKKIWIVSSLVLVMAISFYFHSHQKVADSLLLENVEALAVGEYDVPIHCAGRGTVDCPISEVKVKIVASGYSLEDLR